MEVNVLFFGVLSEVTGSRVRHYSGVSTLDTLKEKIQDDFPDIVHYNYIISVNNTLISKDSPLNDGDEIAFMPPFAGG
jgi:molybdopterin synthase sulfur carrier subunit